MNHLVNEDPDHKESEIILDKEDKNQDQDQDQDHEIDQPII